MGNTFRYKAGKRATTSHYTQVKKPKTAQRDETRRRLEAVRQAQADRAARIAMRRERELGRLLHTLTGIRPRTP